MATIISRSGKGSALSASEYDENIKQETNSQAGDYTVVAGDNRATVEYTGAGGHTITLPGVAATVAGEDTGDFEVTIKHGGSGSLTVDFAVSDTVDGTDQALTLAASEVLTLKAGTGNDWMIINRSIPNGTEGYIMRMGSVNPAWALPYQAVTAYLSTDQAHSSSGSWVDIAFDAESFDPLTAHAAGVFTVPAWANKARFSAEISFEGNGASVTGRRAARVVTGAGALLIPYVGSVTDPTADVNGDTYVHVLSGIVPVTAGGTYKFQAFQNSGGTIQINGTNAATWATVEFFP